MATIEAQKLSGVTVYGVDQMAYTVDGVGGQDYTYALMAACFKEVSAIEASLASTSTIVRIRQNKIHDLGSALVYISRAIGSINTKGGTSTDLSDKIDGLVDSAEIAATYGIRFSLSGEDGNQITLEEGQKASSNIKYSLDMEDNALQQDMVTLQNVISRRDTTFQTATSIMKRSLGTASSTIKAMGK